MRNSVKFTALTLITLLFGSLTAIPATADTTPGGTFASLARVSGVLRTAEGVPVQSAMVGWCPTSGCAWVRTDQSGSYVIEVKLGEQYSIRASSAQNLVNYQDISQEALPANWVVIWKPFTVSSDAQVDLTLPTTKMVNLHWSDASGNPVSGANFQDQDWGLLRGCIDNCQNDPTYAQISSGGPANGGSGYPIGDNSGNFSFITFGVTNAPTAVLTGTNTEGVTVTQKTTISGAVQQTITSAYLALANSSGSVAIRLRVAPQNWAPATTFSYQWLGDGLPIQGQISDSYAPVSYDLGHLLSVEVTGQVAGYHPITVTSNTFTVTFGSIDQALSNNTCGAATLDLSGWRSDSTAMPMVSGDLQVTKSLTGVSGVWPKGLKFCKMWVENGVVLNTALNASRYKSVPSDIGQRIQFVVVGTDRKGVATFRISQPVVITKLSFVNAQKATISGKLNPGSTVRVVNKSWTSGVTYSYQWFRNNVAIPYATFNKYMLTSQDSKTGISVQVCGHKDNYNDLCLTSDPTTIN